MGAMSARAVLAMLSAVVLCTTGLGWVTVGSPHSGPSSTDILSPVPQDGADGTGDGAMDILLVGSDSRTDTQGDPLPPEVLRALRTEQSPGINTDTIIVVRIPHDGSAAHAVSIPRDVSVAVPGEDQSHKINAVYGMRQADVARELRDQGRTDEAEIVQESAQVGRRALVATVEQLTGVRIDHYAEVNLYGFYLLTQAIGGVEVCLNQATSDPGSGADFPAGRQTLSGGDALAFVRQRGGLPRGDLDRIVRQQVFLASAVNEVLSTGTLTDPQRLARLVSALRSSVALDKNWDLLGFAQQMQGIAAGAVTFVTIPVAEVDATDERGQDVIKVDPAQVRAFFTDLADGTAPPLPASPPAPAAQKLTVDVFNGTDVAGLANEVTTLLVEAGFTAGENGNTDPRWVTMIKTAPGQDEVGERISALLGGDIPVLAEPKLADDRIVVLIGADYADRTGDPLTGPPLLRLDGARSAGPPMRPSSAQQTPISADGVPCIN